MDTTKKEIIDRFKKTESGYGELTDREKILLNIALDFQPYKKGVTNRRNVQGLAVTEEQIKQYVAEEYGYADWLQQSMTEKEEEEDEMYCMLMEFNLIASFVKKFKPDKKEEKVMSAEKILELMIDEMPFSLSTSVAPYVLEAIQLGIDQPNEGMSVEELTEEEIEAMGILESLENVKVYPDSNTYDFRQGFKSGFKFGSNKLQPNKFSTCKKCTNLKYNNKDYEEIQT